MYGSNPNGRIDNKLTDFLHHFLGHNQRGRGTHEDLMAIPEGIYQRLYLLQQNDEGEANAER